jgi:hypothetical protein
LRGLRRTLGRCLLVGLLAGLAAPASASVAAPAECAAFPWVPPADGGIRVEDAAGLDAALAKAQRGGTILLAGGNYGRYSLAGYNPSAPVTIGAADPADPPVFNSLMLEHSSNLELAGLTFKVDGTKAFRPSDLDPALRILDSQRITILASLFTGYIEPPGSFFTVGDGMRNTKKRIDFSGLGRGMGMNAARSTGIDVLGSTFSELTVGSNFNRVSDTRFLGNTYTGISLDSSDWGGITNLLFQGNLLTDNVVPRGMKHADFMQFRFSTSRNITIDNNVMISMKPVSHGIYFGGSYMDDYRYANVVISNNLVLASQRLALSIERTDGLTIVGNKVLSNRAAGRAPAALLVEQSSTDVKIANNLANIITAAGPGWRSVAFPRSWSRAGNQTVNGAMQPPAIDHAPGCRVK